MEFAVRGMELFICIHGAYSGISIGVGADVSCYSNSSAPSSFGLMGKPHQVNTVSNLNFFCHCLVISL